MLGAVGLPKKAEGESGWLLPQIYDLLLYQLSYIPIGHQVVTEPVPLSGT